MKIISLEKDFNLIEMSINIIMDKSKLLPENVFRETLKYFLFVTFDELLMTLFFNHLRQYLIGIGEKDFWLAVIDPDPKSYFAANFNFYGAFEFSSTDDEADYVSALNDYPKGSTADALMHNSNSLIVSSFTNKWAVFGNRGADIAICAFSDHAHMKLFRSSYGSDLLNDMKAAAKYAYGDSDKNSQAERFCMNYSTG